MKHGNITFEVCSNTEWLRDCAGMDLDSIEDGYEDEAAKHYCSELHANLVDAGFQTDTPNHGRSLYHGWNGANTFKHLLGPIGTFNELTKEQQDIAWMCIEAAKASAERKYAKCESAAE